MRSPVEEREQLKEKRILNGIVFNERGDSRMVSKLKISGWERS